MFVDTHRPQHYRDYVGDPRTVDLVRAIAALPATADMPPNNLLFQGSAGTGKTSLAQMLMTELNANCLVLNASDRRGVEEVRGLITAFASQPTVCFGEAPRPKWVVMDEADQLPPLTQTELAALAERIRGKTRFLYIVNHSSAMVEPLVSQCTTIPFLPLSVPDQTRRLASIAASEKTGALWGTDAIEGVATLARGDLRTAVHLLQIIGSLAPGGVDAEDVSGEDDIGILLAASTSPPTSPPTLPPTPPSTLPPTPPPPPPPPPPPITTPLLSSSPSPSLTPPPPLSPSSPLPSSLPPPLPKVAVARPSLIKPLRPLSAASATSRLSPRTPSSSLLSPLFALHRSAPRSPSPTPTPRSAPPNRSVAATSRPSSANARGSAVSASPNADVAPGQRSGFTKNQVYAYRFEPTDEFVDGLLDRWRHASFADATRETWSALAEGGISVLSLLNCVTLRVAAAATPSVGAKLGLLVALSDIESAINRTADARTQLYALVGAWKSAGL